MIDMNRVNEKVIEFISNVKGRIFQFEEVGPFKLHCVSLLVSQTCYLT